MCGAAIAADPVRCERDGHCCTLPTLAGPAGNRTVRNNALSTSDQILPILMAAIPPRPTPSSASCLAFVAQVEVPNAPVYPQYGPAQTQQAQNGQAVHGYGVYSTRSSRGAWLFAPTGNAGANS